MAAKVRTVVIVQVKANVSCQSRNVPHSAGGVILFIVRYRAGSINQSINKNNAVCARNAVGTTNEGVALGVACCLLLLVQTGEFQFH
jgi:hypothetical protein